MGLLGSESAGLAVCLAACWEIKPVLFLRRPPCSTHTPLHTPRQVLDVSRCANLGSDALDVHPRCTLEVLRAAGCNALRSVVIQLPSEAPLRSLSLEGCRQLRELVLVAHRLEAAAFSHCGQLRHVSLRCR